MSMVEITNKSKATFVFTLYHDVFCVSAGECKCSKQDVLRSVSGGMQYQQVTSPVGVYLEPDTSIELDAAAGDIPQVREASKRGIIKVKEIET